MADRFDRRLVLVVDALLDRAAVAAADWVWRTVTTSLPVVWIYLLLVVNAIGQTLGSPSRTALLPWIDAAGTVRQLR